MVLTIAFRQQTGINKLVSLYFIILIGSQHAFVIFIYPSDTYCFPTVLYAGTAGDTSELEDQSKTLIF